MTTTRLHQLTTQKAVLEANNEALHRRVAELQMQVAVLEQRVEGLRGLGTPGLVLEAIGEIKEAAVSGKEIAGQQVLFWTTVGDWATKLGTEEREEWGDLL